MLLMNGCKPCLIGNCGRNYAFPRRMLLPSSLKPRKTAPLSSRWYEFKKTPQHSRGIGALNRFQNNLHQLDGGIRLAQSACGVAHGR